MANEVTIRKYYVANKESGVTCYHHTEEGLSISLKPMHVDMLGSWEETVELIRVLLLALQAQKEGTYKIEDKNECPF
jgi:hypothetical protein